MENKSTEYTEGYRAGKRGLTPRENPYEKGTTQHDDFLDGMIDASL